MPDVPRPPTVAAVVYSLDEAELLAACLPALTGFDVVVVCDMQSTDDTRAVAARCGAVVVDVPRVPAVEDVRQLGLDAVTTDWVLFVDADERVPAGYADAVRRLVEHDPGPVAWAVGYRNFAFGIPLEHTLTGMTKFALLRRGFTRYTAEGLYHRPPIMDGEVGDATALLPRIDHFSYRTVEQSVQRALRYAGDAYESDDLLSPFGFAREVARSLVFSGTWRDGRPGVTVSMVNLVARWYSAAISAERRRVLGHGYSDREQRLLGRASAVQARSVRSRDRLHAGLQRVRRRPERGEPGAGA